jgi:hypothetical protein
MVSMTRLLILKCLDLTTFEGLFLVVWQPRTDNVDCRLRRGLRHMIRFNDYSLASFVQSDVVCWSEEGTSLWCLDYVWQTSFRGDRGGKALTFSDSGHSVVARGRLSNYTIRYGRDHQAHWSRRRSRASSIRVRSGESSLPNWRHIVI